MTNKEKEELRTLSTSTLLINDQRVVGRVILSKYPYPRGIWIELNHIVHFLGSTKESALITAKIGDCWNEQRDGYLRQADIEWFERRGVLRAQWRSEETDVLEHRRRVRVQLNRAWTENYAATENDDSEMLYLPWDSENDDSSYCGTQHPCPQMCIEIIRVQGWKGLWVLDDDVESFQAVTRLYALRDKYVIQLSTNKRHARSGLLLRTKMKLDIAGDGTLIMIRVYDDNFLTPMLILRNNGRDQLTLEKLWAT